MDLRPATAGETAVTLLAAAVGVGGTVLAWVLWLDWTARPLLAAVALVVMALGDVAVAGVARAPRPVLIQIARLSELPRVTRGALRSELWAGRPGPPSVRRQAVGWADRALRTPGATGFWIFLAGFNLAAVQHTGGPGTGPVELVGLGTALACLLAGVAHGARRRRARQVAASLLAPAVDGVEGTVDLDATAPIPVR